MNGDGAITYDDWARIVVELCLLGVSVGALRQEWDSYERVLADDWSSGTPSPMLRNLRRELLDDRAV